MKTLQNKSPSLASFCKYFAFDYFLAFTSREPTLLYKDISIIRPNTYYHFSPYTLQFHNNLIVNRVSDSLYGEKVFFFSFLRRQIYTLFKPYDFSASNPFISLLIPNPYFVSPPSFFCLNSFYFFILAKSILRSNPMIFLLQILLFLYRILQRGM